MSVINEVAERRSRDEAIEALRAQVARLKSANEELTTAIQEYGDYRNWEYRGNDVYHRSFTFGDSTIESGWCFGRYMQQRAEMALKGEPLPPNTYFEATTAPDTERSA